jgi:hypothetical protein
VKARWNLPTSENHWRKQAMDVKENLDYMEVAA